MSIKAGDVYVFELRFYRGGKVQRRLEQTVRRVTPKRVYFGNGSWFALADPAREIRPRYINYITTATPAPPNESEGEK